MDMTSVARGLTLLAERMPDAALDVDHDVFGAAFLLVHNLASSYSELGEERRGELARLGGEEVWEADVWRAPI